MPRVSVLIAAFNAEAFIHRAIESALSQEGVEVEVVVIDDASTDDTAKVVGEISDRDARVRLIRLQQNGGPSVARNRGIEEASGEWIAVLDADDAYRPDRLRQLVHVGTNNDAQIVADNFVYYDPGEDRDSEPALRLTPAIQLLDLETFIRGARPYGQDADFGLLKPIFRRSFLMSSGLRYPLSIRHGEDFELLLFCLKAGARYVLARDGAYYRYTARTSGWSRTKVDYSGQIDRTYQLAKRPEFSGSPAVIAALRDRANALGKLHGVFRYRQRRSEAGKLGRLMVDLTSSHGLKSLFARLTGPSSSSR